MRCSKTKNSKFLREAVHAAQLNLFATARTSDAPMSASSVGLEVKLPTKCKCGAPSAAICSGTETHPGELRCPKCGKHRGWMSHETFGFLSSVIDRFGSPTEPVIVRAGTNGK
jgi:hypothetical protein